MRASRPCPDCVARADGVLRELTTRSGTTAAEWLWAPAAGEPVHLALAPGPLMTVHPGVDGPAWPFRADATALPVRSKSIGALVVSSVLPVLPDLDALFAEFRRVLRPHGLLAVLIPTGPALGPRHHGLRARVRDGWQHRSAVDHPEWLATAADFAVLGDDRVRFHGAGRATPDDPAGTVDRWCAAGLLPPGLTAPVRGELADRPAVRAGRVTLRRIVARR